MRQKKEKLDYVACFRNSDGKKVSSRRLISSKGLRAGIFIKGEKVVEKLEIGLTRSNGGEMKVDQRILDPLSERRKRGGTE